MLILAAWIAGGLLAMLGAFIYAELADHMPAVGGQYAYLRSAYHPLVGFLYGWVLLLVVQTGGMAAVTVTFARYFLEIYGSPLSERGVAIVTLAVLTLVNCLGVRLGSRVQSILTVLKIAAIATLVSVGLFLVPSPFPLSHPAPQSQPALDLLAAFATAMIPVLFAYGGWQTANFIAGEIKDPRRNLPRALILGVAGVCLLYVTVNLACVRALGAQGLAGSTTPATAVMRLAMGKGGATFIALGIAVSTIGFLSQSVLTAPRVYFAMAKDGVFFRSVARINPRTHAPVVAIVLQSVWTAIVVLSGRYDQILNYVVSMDFLFFGLTATCLFVFRSRERRSVAPRQDTSGYRVPGHPWTTGFFVVSCFSIVANTLYRFPSNSLIGIVILFLGVPVYALWRHKSKLGNS
jgi:APA family basic amino acid/polyamine antiporter